MIKDNLLQVLEDKCQSIHEALDDRRPKDFLYHYTNYESLVCILKNRKMRYTDYRFFNDPTEIKYGQNVAINCIATSDLPHKDLLFKVINQVFDVFNNDCNIFISCYSAKIDELALWRYYGNNGCGFAIAFNSAYQSIDTEGQLGKSFISQVIYGEAGTSLVNEFIKVYLEILSEAKKTISYGEFLKEADKIFISYLLGIIPILKDQSFKDENEIRLCCLEGKLLINPKTKKPFEFTEEVRDFIEIENKNIPFVNGQTGKKPVLYPDQFDHNSISEIWVGPACEFSEARVAVRKLLLDNGFDVNKIEIKHAQFPYCP